MKKIVVALLLSASISAPALAAEQVFYGALDFGRTTAGDACSTTGLPAGSTLAGCKETGTLSRLAGGYQFTPMWGVEVSYGNYGKASLGTATVPGYGTIAGGDWELSGTQVSGTATIPLGDSFALIWKLGIASTDLKLTAASLSSTTAKLAYGIGAQYEFTKSVAVRAQYENLGTVGDANTTGTAKVSLLSAGVVLKF